MSPEANQVLGLQAYSALSNYLFAARTSLDRPTAKELDAALGLLEGLTMGDL